MLLFYTTWKGSVFGKNSECKCTRQNQVKMVVAVWLTRGGRGLTIAPFFKTIAQMKKNVEKAYKNESPGFCMSYVF